MKTLIFSAKDFEIPFLKQANSRQHPLSYTSERLNSQTAMKAIGFKAISIFSADDASAPVLEKLHDFGVCYVSLRSAGYDNVNLAAAEKLGIRVANAPDYSPYAVAEHAVALLQALNRKIALSRKQTQAYDFSLSNLVGRDLFGKTVGIVGTGKIGSVLARIMDGFGCTLLATDPNENQALKSHSQLSYCDLDTLCRESDIVFLCLPLTSETHQLIHKATLNQMKKEAMLINVARGGVVHTGDVLDAIKHSKLGGYATDVYDKEAGVFFYDRSAHPPQDKILDKLLFDDRILLTPHQAFATKEALTNIAQTTIQNLNAWDAGTVLNNELTPLSLGTVESS